MALSIIGFEAMVLMPTDNPNMWESINAIATTVISMGGILCDTQRLNQVCRRHHLNLLAMPLFRFFIIVKVEETARITKQF